MTNHNQSFRDLLVLDMTRYLPGAYATQILADLGAEVVKIEDTAKGDLCRHDYPFINGVSYYFTALCRNKKSLSLNLKNTDGHEVFMKLAERADIIVESFRPGVTKRLGVDYESIKQVNAKIVYCSYSAFGQDDPRSLKAVHDLNMQGLSGYLSINGGVDAPIHLPDIASAMVAAQGMLAALYDRERTGQGSYVDVSMFDSFVWWNSLVDSRFHFLGEALEAQDLEYPAVCYNVYTTRDGRTLTFAALEEKFWTTFCTEAGVEDLIPVKLCRRHEAPEAFDKMERLVASKTLSEWNEWLADKDICVAPVATKAEAIKRIVDSNAGMMAYRDFPITGRVLQTNIPHRISALPVSLADASPPPPLGQHNLEILERLGYRHRDAVRMAETGAINAVLQ
ncbi:MAG: CoA transferase [Bifidobacteriaceae bacterium]|jgi:crotonobetainyl-CoA:carnitine CoA-transferase CaiB-like acyl-CoA transferase|nr:CoA transferase [Bifidobacteriaceae bacterium]